MTFGFVIAHRQIVTIVRYKKYNIHPRDLHILINLVSGNASLQLTEAQTWSPICLPKFNDTLVCCFSLFLIQLRVVHI